MNDMASQLGALAHSVSDDYRRTAPDNAAILVRRARRGRVVWTTAVGSAALASGVALAVGGAAAAGGGLRGPAPAANVTNPGPTLRSEAETAPVHALAPKAAAVAVEKQKTEKTDQAKKAAKAKKAEKAAKASKASKASKANKAKSAKEGAKGKKNGKHWKYGTKAGTHSAKDCGDTSAHKGEKSKGWYKDKDKGSEGGEASNGDQGSGGTEGSTGDSADAPATEG